jgi:hypothetical protein
MKLYIVLVVIGFFVIFIFHAFWLGVFLVFAGLVIGLLTGEITSGGSGSSGGGCSSCGGCGGD